MRIDFRISFSYVILGSKRQMESVFLPSSDQFGLAHEALLLRYGRVFPIAFLRCGLEGQLVNQLCQSFFSLWRPIKKKSKYLLWDVVLNLISVLSGGAKADSQNAIPLPLLTAAAIRSEVSGTEADWLICLVPVQALVSSLGYQWVSGGTPGKASWSDLDELAR